MERRANSPAGRVHRHHHGAFDPSRICWVLPEKIYPRGFGDQGAEAYFASVTERAESLARFGPPGFDLGTPAPGVQLVPSWLLPSELGLTVSATGAGSAIFPAEAGPSQRWLLLQQIMHKQRISLHILSDYSVLVASLDELYHILWSTIR